MHIPVNDKHAIQTVLVDRPLRAERDMVEKAEPHSLIAGGVMTRGPNEAKRASFFPRDDLINGIAHGSSRRASYVERS